MEAARRPPPLSWTGGRGSGANPSVSRLAALRRAVPPQSRQAPSKRSQQARQDHRQLVRNVRRPPEHPQARGAKVRSTHECDSDSASVAHLSDIVSAGSWTCLVTAKNSQRSPVRILGPQRGSIIRSDNMFPVCFRATTRSGTWAEARTRQRESVGAKWLAAVRRVTPVGARW